MKKEVYPDWKIIAWRFIRTFLASLSVQLLMVGESITTQDKLVIALEIALIVAIAKTLRIMFGNADGEGVINRIPL